MTNRLFKLYVPIQDRGLFVNIFPKGRKLPLIFTTLMDIYMAEGLSKKDAAEKAGLVIQDFFYACDKISTEGDYPFIIDIKDLDMTKLNTHGKL